MVELDAYIYRNLREYGNCLIGYRFIKQYGKQPILNHLKTKGFKAQLIEITGNYSPSKHLREKTYILELVGYSKK